MLGLLAAAGTEHVSNDVILGGYSIAGKQPGGPHSPMPLTDLIQELPKRRDAADASLQCDSLMSQSD